MPGVHTVHYMYDPGTLIYMNVSLAIHPGT
jgi:hypothetical protein